MTSDDSVEQAKIYINSLSNPQSTQVEWSLCLGTTKLGARCRATPGPDHFCAQHSPSTTAEMKTEWGRRGQKSSVLVRREHHLETVIEKAIERANVALLTTREQLVAAGLPVPDFSTVESVQTALEDVAASVASNRMAPSQGSVVLMAAKLGIELAALKVDRDLLELELARARNALPAAPLIQRYRP